MHNLRIFQESRPLGATLVSGCSVLTGSEEEDQESGVAKPFTFRLKLDSNVSSNPAVLCLATDNQESLDQLPGDHDDAVHDSWLDLLHAPAQGLEEGLVAASVPRDVVHVPCHQ